MNIPIARSDGGFTLDQQKTEYRHKLVVSRQDEKRKETIDLSFMTYRLRASANWQEWYKESR